MLSMQYSFGPGRRNRLMVFATPLDWISPNDISQIFPPRVAVVSVRLNDAACAPLTCRPMGELSPGTPSAGKNRRLCPSTSICLAVAFPDDVGVGGNVTVPTLMLIIADAPFGVPACKLAPTPV